MYSVILTAPRFLCVRVCLPSVQGLSVAATAKRPLRSGKRPDRVTAADWTSCFFLFFSPSYLLCHTLCLPLCDSPCERGSDKVTGAATSDTKVDILTCWHQWETFLCVCVLLDSTGGTQTPSCGLWEHRGHLRSLLFLWFC